MAPAFWSAFILTKSNSTYGGILMFIVGVFYIIFQESIAPPYSANLRKRSTADNISRLVMGLQVRDLPLYTMRSTYHIRKVGMIPLAIILTRGSVASLQAKRGLPLGNQIVGWLTLGEYAELSIGYPANGRSCFSCHTVRTPNTSR